MPPIRLKVCRFWVVIKKIETWVVKTSIFRVLNIFRVLKSASRTPQRILAKVVPVRYVEVAFEEEVFVVNGAEE